MGVRKREDNQTDTVKTPVKRKASSGAGRTRKPRQAAGNGVSAERRHQLIAETAYLLAEQRGFGAEGSLDDWLQAERTVDGHLMNKGGGAGESAS